MRSLVALGSVAAMVVGLLAFATPAALADDSLDADESFEGFDVTEGLAPPELTDDDDGLSYPNLGSTLSGIADDPDGAQYTAGYLYGDGYTGGSVAGTYVPDGANNQTGTMLGLSIIVDGDVQHVVNVINANGGDVRNVLGDQIEAFVPATALSALAQTPGVTWARELAQPLKARGNVTSGGVAEHLASQWHQAGIKGQGVKVGVIDSSSFPGARDSFTGLPALMGTEVPSEVNALCFTHIGQTTNDIADCSAPARFLLGGGDIHGTIVAETVMDVAPDASLYISNPRSALDLVTATKWMHAQGVDVIVYSIVWAFHGPADGTSPYSNAPLNTVKWAADNGIVWVNAAGNHHLDTWFGPFTDDDDDDIHEFKANTEHQTLTSTSNRSVIAFMRWDDTWDGADDDLALIVLQNPGEQNESVVKKFNDPQSGGSRHDPIEGGSFNMRANVKYGLRIESVDGAEPNWVQLVVWGNAVLSVQSDGYSIMSPSDSPHKGVLSVGAGSPNSIHSYSSRGPSPDGRILPDIVGAACQATKALSRFCGTSAAGPHVGGLAALVAQQNPTFTPTQTTDFLIAHAAENGSPVPNSVWGHGFAQLPSLACSDEIDSSAAVSGSWTSACNSEPSAWRSHYYTFTLPTRTTVDIDLASSIDSYLFLRQGFNAQFGTVLHEDDNSGSGTNARISATLDAGRYTIEATTAAAGQTGTFSLQVGGLSAVPTVSITGGADVTEGSDVSFTVSANPVPTAPLAVKVQITATGDYGVTSGERTVTIPATGATTFTVSTTGDSLGEPHGSIVASLRPSADYHSSGTDWRRKAVIEDDDRAPEISISAGPDVTEGSDAVFTLRADRAPSADLVVTVDVSQSGDFVTPGSQTVTISAATTSATLAVATIDDSTPETDGRVTVAISSGSDYTISSSAGDATLLLADNDPDPCRSHISSDGKISGQWITTCDSLIRGGRHATFFTIQLAEPSKVTMTLRSSQDTYMFLRKGKNVRNRDQIARNDDIYPGRDFNSRISRQLAVGWYTIEATTYSLNRTGEFELEISGLPATSSMVPEISIAADGDVTEGADASFTVTATPAPTADLDVTVAVTVSGDFGVTAAAHTVTVPSSGSATLVLSTTNDSTDEAEGSVTATLGGGTGYTVSSTQGSATVAVSDDDRAPPEISVSAGLDVTEGSDAVFTLRADRAPSADLVVTVDVSQSGDFVTPGSQTVTISAATTSATLAVATTDDSTPETDGRVTVAISSGSDYTVSGSAGDATLLVADNDSDPCRSHISSDGKISGRWITTCDSLIRGGRHAKFFTIQLDEPSKVTMTLRSSRDTYMFLRKGKNVRNRDEIARNDDIDAGRNFNSRISRQLAVGWYTIEATTYSSNRTGVFELEISGLPATNTEPEISIAAGTDITEGGDAVFTVTASPAPAADLDVTVDVSQSGDFGAATGTQTVTVPSSGSATLTVSTSGDSSDEPDGSVTATVDSGSGYTVSSTQGSASVAVSDDDVPVVSVTAGNAVIEGSPASFTVSASPAPHAALSVDVSVGAAGDFGVTTGTRTVTVPTSGSATLTIATSGDSIDEADGSVTVTVGSGSGYTVSSAQGTASVVVNDDDAACVSPSDAVTVAEVTGWRDAFPGDTARVLRWNRVLRALGENVNATAMTVVESQANESIFGARWDRVTRTLQARECGNPPPATPEISISAGNGVTEGGDATYTVTASPSPAAALSVSVNVAQSGDFGVTTGSRTVSIPTTGSATLTVSTSGDSVDEAHGSVTATVVSGNGYTVSSTNGTATVAVSDDDDPPPSVPVVSITAGNGVTEGGDATFTVTASPAPAAALSVSVAVAQSGDFAASTATRTVSIPVSGSVTLTIATTNDRTDEPDGSVTATVNTGNGYTVSQINGAATVSVEDDDDPPPATPVVSITGGNGVTEGSAATFTVSANPRPSSPLRVDVSVAAQGSFGVTTGTRTVTVPTGGSVTLSVSTSGDSIDEPNGSVTVSVSSGSGYTVSSTNDTATVAVSDDDDPPPPPSVTISIGDASGEEGLWVTFKVTLSEAVGHQVKVRWESDHAYDLDPYAIAGDEFWYMDGTLTFAPGQTERSASVYLNDDSYAEADELFRVRLSSPQGATIADGEGIMTITDND